MSSYQITVYHQSDLNIVHTGGGNYTVTVKEGATPDTITVYDTDKGENSHIFNDGAVGGADRSENLNQTFSGKLNGTEHEDASISPDWTIDFAGEEEGSMFSLTVGEGHQFVGYGFTKELEPGESINLCLRDRESIDMRPDIEMDPDAPCFTRGTMILTKSGEIAVENLAVGDLIWTEESGYQKLAWVGMRDVLAIGAMVPVCIKSGTLGTNADLIVSAEHRMVIRDGILDAVFGTKSALVSAKNLINDQTIMRDYSAIRVEYYHLAFEDHKTICANGALTESFFPDEKSFKSAPIGQKEELLALFPELANDIALTQPAHPTLTANEAVLMSQLMVFESSY